MGIILNNNQMVGECLGRRQFADLTLSHNGFGPGQSSPLHAHNGHDFYMVVRGSCHETSENIAYDLQAFQMAFHPAYSEHRGWAGTQGTFCFHLTLGHNWLARHSGERLLPKQVTTYKGGELVWLAGKLFREYRSGNLLSPLTIEGLALEMLGCLEKNRDQPRLRPPDWLKRAQELVQDEWNFCHSVGSVAAQVGVHPIHLSRTFRRFHGYGLGEYQQQLRIRKACALLTSKATPLAQIAQETGFADQSHFTKIFKKWTGTTPSQFRRQAQV